MSEEDKNKMSERNWFDRFFPPILAGLLGWCASEAYFKRSNYIPKTDKVQSGYVIPNKLEIKLEDLDGNGEKETLVRYNGKSYLLRIDSNGKPTVDAYEVRPAEVVPKTN